MRLPFNKEKLQSKKMASSRENSFPVAKTTFQKKGDHHKFFPN